MTPPPSSFFHAFFCRQDRKLYDFLNQVIVDRQELILNEYMACSGHDVRSSRLGNTKTGYF